MIKSLNAMDRTQDLVEHTRAASQSTRSTRDLREIIRPRERDLKEPYGGGPNPRRRSVAAYGPVSDGHI